MQVQMLYALARSIFITLISRGNGRVDFRIDLPDKLRVDQIFQYEEALLHKLAEIVLLGLVDTALFQQVRNMIARVGPVEPGTMRVIGIEPGTQWPAKNVGVP